MDLDLVVAIPDLDKLSVINKYDDIYLESIGADLFIELYSGELHAEECGWWRRTGD